MCPQVGRVEEVIRSYIRHQEDEDRRRLSSQIWLRHTWSLLSNKRVVSSGPQVPAG
jgi:hypothetical protein